MNSIKYTEKQEFIEELLETYNFVKTQHTTDRIDAIASALLIARRNYNRSLTDDEILDVLAEYKKNVSDKYLIEVIEKLETNIANAKEKITKER